MKLRFKASMVTQALNFAKRKKKIPLIHDPQCLFFLQPRQRSWLGGRVESKNWEIQGENLLEAAEDFRLRQTFMLQSDLKQPELR